MNAALALSFPLQILRIAIDLYSGPRRITFRRAFSGEVHINRAIAPGCTFATFILRLLLTWVIDPILGSMPRDIRDYIIYGTNLSF